MGIDPLQIPALIWFKSMLAELDRLRKIISWNLEETTDPLAFDVEIIFQRPVRNYNTFADYLRAWATANFASIKMIKLTRSKHGVSAKLYIRQRNKESNVHPLEVDRYHKYDPRRNK